MNIRMFAWTAAILCLVLVPGTAFGQVVAMQDFEGPLPGPQGYPGGYSFFGEGDDLADMTVVEEVTDLVAASGVQSFQITLDNSAIDSWWYYGMGGFHGFWSEGAGAAGGQAGEDNPGNFKMSFDIQIEGVLSGDKVVEGQVSIYKSDYEAVYNVDLNNDGDLLDGYDIWVSRFSTNIGMEPGWVHVEWNLAQGTTPTADPLITTPYFDDETTFAFQLYPFNSPGGFGFDSDNVINIDNVALEFVPPTATPGDFDGDGDVDGRDFLAWQRDPGVGSLSDWQNSYPTGGLTAGFVAVPEPASLLFALSAALFAGSRRRS